MLYRLGRFKLKAKVKLKKTIPATQLMNREFVAAHPGERYVSEGANLKKRLVEDLFHNSLPSLLRYEDKNTMRFSLEGRVPFLDKEVLKFIFSLSDEAIIKDGWNKRVLRDATRGLLPESINRRRNKIGFTTPQVEWFMRLKNHFYNIFLSESFANRPYVNQTEVIAAFEGWIKGANDVDTMTFWRLINLELWMREFIDDHDADADAATRRAGRPRQDRLRAERGPQSSTSRPRSASPCGATRCAPSSSAATTTSTPGCSSTSTASSPGSRPPVPTTTPPPVARGGSSCPRRSSPSPRAGPTSSGTSRSAARRGCCRATSRALPPASAWAARSRCSWPSRRPACPACSTRRPAARSARSSGRKGLFYELVGNDINAIDGPTEYSAYPSNVSAKLAPKDPDAVAARLTAAIRQRVPEPWRSTFGGTVIMDANDIGRNVLGSDVPGDWARFEEMFADNPLGQGTRADPDGDGLPARGCTSTAVRALGAEPAAGRPAVRGSRPAPRPRPAARPWRSPSTAASRARRAAPP